MYNFKLISLFLFTLYIPTFQVWECWFCDNLHNVFIHYRGAAYDIHERTYALYCTHCTVLYCTHWTVPYCIVLPLFTFSSDCLVLIIFYIVFTLYWILYYVVCCYTLYVICCVVLIIWDCKVYILDYIII
jgi:hypothetical protein